MTDYTETPELKIQHDITAAQQAGATHATITLFREHVQVDDNRNGDDHPPHRATHEIQIHPSRYRHEFHQNVSEHIAPAGIVVNVHGRHRHHRESTVKLRNVYDNVDIIRDFPELHCDIYITNDRNIPGLTIVAPDGTSTRHSFHNFHGMGSLRYLPPFSKPNTPIRELSLAAVAVADPGHQAPKPEDLYAPAIQLAREFAFQQHHFTANCLPPGISWPSNHLKHVYELLHPNPADTPHSWPTEPSTCKYRLPGHPNWQEFLTPDDAVTADFDQVQAPALKHALEQGDTPNFTLVQTTDPNVPVLSLIHTDIENVDGTHTRYPARSPDQDNKTEYYDGYLLASGEHIPTTRVEQVSRITLTFEIQSPDASKAPQRFYVDTDVYVDQDFHHDLLLITVDSEVTNQQLHNMVSLYETDTNHLDEEQRMALHDGVRNWTTDFLVDQLKSGTPQALQNVLAKAASSVEALTTAHQVQVHQQSFTTPAGTVTISLTPTPSQPDAQE